MAQKQLLHRVRSAPTFMIITVGLGLLSVGMPLFSLPYFAAFRRNLIREQDLFLYALVVPIIPSLLSSQIHLSDAILQRATSLMLTSYALSAVLASVPAGWAADRFARRRSTAFLTGLTALAAGTIMFLAGRSVTVLVLARALQGTSTAVVWTVGLAMLLDTVGMQRMGATIGSIFGVIGGAQLAAPVLGGWLFEKTGTAGVAAVALSVLAIDFVMRIAVLEEKDGSQKHGGEGERANGANPHADSASTESASETRQDNESDPLLASALPPDQSATLQRPASTPRSPILHLLRDPRLLSAQLLQLTQSTQLSALDATVPTEARSLLGYSSGPTSLLFLPLVIPFVLCNPIFGRLVDRVGPKAPALAGLIAQVPILVALRGPAALLHAGAAREASVGLWAALLALLGIAIAGGGSGAIVAAGIVAEKNFAKLESQGKLREGKRPYAQLFAVNSIMASAGLALGPALAGLLREKMGYGNMNAVLAGFSACSCFICYIYLAGWPTFRGRYSEQAGQSDENANEPN